MPAKLSSFLDLMALHEALGKLALEAGAIPTGDMTDVMAQAKFMWALTQGHRSPGGPQARDGDQFRRGNHRLRELTRYLML